MIHLEHVVYVPFWRWKLTQSKGVRRTKIPPTEKPCYMLRWGFWQLHFYKD